MSTGFTDPNMGFIPTETPNVVIESPKLRKLVRTAIDSIGGLAFIAGAVDMASNNLDFAAWTIPVMAAYTAARVVFGFAVDSPNTPR